MISSARWALGGSPGYGFMSVAGTGSYIGAAASNPLVPTVTISRYADGVWQLGTTANNDSGSWRATNGTLLGDLICSTVGKGLQIKGGSALARAGNATLVAGTVTVANTTTTANTVIQLTRKTSGGTIGMAVTYTLSAGASFTISSDSALDTSTYSFLMIEVNP